MVYSKNNTYSVFFPHLTTFLKINFPLFPTRPHSHILKIAFVHIFNLPISLYILILKVFQIFTINIFIFLLKLYILHILTLHSIHINNKKTYKFLENDSIKRAIYTRPKNFIVYN
jgi:hypothetical protein